ICTSALSLHDALPIFGVEGELEQLRQLHQRVETHLVELGYPVEKRNFRPHLTLARNYKGKNRFEFNQSGWPERFNGELSWRVERSEEHTSELQSRENL